MFAPLFQAHGQTTIYTIASGSSTYQTAFAPDNYFVGGNRGTYSNNSIDASSVSTDAYTPVFQNERNGTFTYTFPNLTAGQSYTVKLLFAEIVYTAAGQRMFNVAINTVPYLQNFDIIAESGAANKAMDKTYKVNANSSGQIVIAFTNGSAGTAKVSGIEIITVPPVSSGVASASASVIYQINSGGSSSGTYSADKFYTNGTAASPSTTVTTTAVNNPAPAAVYATERYGTFSYTLPNLVANQIYTVRLHFAEIAYTKPLQRQFNVSINGATVLTNFDIVAAAGQANTAIVEAFPAAASSSGQIVINFFKSSSAIDNPKSSAIELVTGYRINAGSGGASYWEAEQNYLGGGLSQVSTAIGTSQASDPAPVSVYQAQRYGYATYTIHGLTPNNAYAVRAHFAEVVYNSPGQREFNVYVNGNSSNNLALQNYDIFGNAGASNQANIQAFPVTADSSGQLSLFFSAGAVDGPTVAGFEVTGGGGSTLASGQYLISGKVLLSGSNAAVADATITLTTSGGQSVGLAVSASDGSYSFVVNPGSYVVSAALLHYTMSSQLSPTVTNASQPNQNFTASGAYGGNLSPSLPAKEYIFMNGQVIAVEHPH